MYEVAAVCVRACVRVRVCVCVCASVCVCKQSHDTTVVTQVSKGKKCCLTSTETTRLVRDGEKGEGGRRYGGRGKREKRNADATLVDFQPCGFSPHAWL